MNRFSFSSLCIAATLLRVVLLLYGEWQDRHLTVKYTDIDYIVFTDAARHMTQGGSPYERATYRYTPLLAALLTPNIYWFRSFGKCLFAAADILVGYLVHQILVLRGMPSQNALWLDALWLLNPMVANISTRGNAESLLGVMVLGTLYLIMTRRFFPACALFGLSVHFKIYPIIYAVPLLILLDARYGDDPVEMIMPQIMWSYQQVRLRLLQLSDGYQEQQASSTTTTSRLLDYLEGKCRLVVRRIVLFLTPTRVMFGVASASVFFVLTWCMYQM